MPATINITEQDVYTALRAFLLGIFPADVEVLQGLDNRVPMPKTGPGVFVIMTSAGMDRIETVINNYTGNDTKSITAPTKYTIQLDFYGPNSQQWASTTQALFRDFYGYDAFPANIKPLFADTPVQMPLVDAESQYEERWKLTATLQYNPVITVSQEYFATVDINLLEVDTRFPP